MISVISDTANWVAWYRALESARPDPLFRDPWAATLAGERGQAIALSMRGTRDAAGVVAVRTMLIDRMLSETVRRERLDTVVNLACGFDTRPFRLELPKSLRWFDVDGPAIIGRKREVLQGASARCNWQPLIADLSDSEARRCALHKAMSEAQRALVLTEGLLLYLHPDQVAELATDLAAEPACTGWITDLLSAEGKLRAAAIYKKPFAQSGIDVRFGPQNGAAFFAPFGFVEAEAESTSQEALKLDRLPRLYVWAFALMNLSARNRDRITQSSRVIRLARREPA